MTGRSAARQAISERVAPRSDDPLLEVRIQIHFLEAPTSVIYLDICLGLPRWSVLRTFVEHIALSFTAYQSH